ncbi:MAG TPA: pantoate--beta-alanine ligase, partial [Anaerolineales bacterium]|nr:pantoate--beta-alanine ligase [Anaerolineales bacterium]
MKTIESLQELTKTLHELPRPLALVPTMGFLHEGHLTLARRAKEIAASVVVSIFVNPTQFGPGEDLEAYPRDLQRDLALLEDLGVDLVWNPTPETMYPANYQTWVEVTDVTKPLEGGYRPGHFRGVTTVVSKLFNAVRPDVAVFGQKDAQQVAVIQQMTRDLSCPIEIDVVPIVREADGLALSSRNTYLDENQRKAATVLNRALRAAEQAYRAGERSGDALRKVMADIITAEPLASAQYVSCADRLTLQELETIRNGA